MRKSYGGFPWVNTSQFNSAPSQQILVTSLLQSRDLLDTKYVTSNVFSQGLSSAITSALACEALCPVPEDGPIRHPRRTSCVGKVQGGTRLTCRTVSCISTREGSNPRPPKWGDRDLVSLSPRPTSIFISGQNTSHQSENPKILRSRCSAVPTELRFGMWVPPPVPCWSDLC